MNDFRAWVASLPVDARAGQVHVRHDGAVARIVLDAPRTRNALTPGMMVAFADAVTEARGARIVVLAGANGTFCSGGDLDAVRTYLARPGMGRVMGGFMHAALAALEALEVPVLGVLEGAAMGGGAELLATCDHVLAHTDARLGWVQARVGVSPGFGGATRLARRIGATRAAALLFEARSLRAPEALSRGLVDVVTDEVGSATDAWIQQVLALHPTAVRSSLRAARGPPEKDRLAHELDAFDACWGGEAHLAALDLARAGR